MIKRWLTFVGLLTLLVTLCAVARLLPHPPNFTPAASVALLAGYLFRRRVAALLVPVLALGISDAVIGTYDWRVMATVYAAAAFPVFLRGFLKQKFLVARATACAAGSAVLFFLSTNFAVWLCSAAYPHTPAGLAQCYVAAAPFFQYTLGGDLFWSGALFGGYWLAVGLPTAMCTNPRHTNGIKPQTAIAIVLR